MNLKTSNNATIHTGVEYDRIAHAEYPEELYINPSNLWRVAECPASARKICRAANHIKDAAKTGLTVDRIVTEAIRQHSTPREVAPDVSEGLLQQADGYFKRLQKLQKIHPDAEMTVEAELSGSWIPRFEGLSDCVVYVPGKRRMIIIDHKTGTNKNYAADDLQLKCYAVMAYDDLSAKGREIDEVYLMIIQPSLERSVRSIRYDIASIEAWREEIAGIVQYAAEHPNEAHPGCYRCLFCPWAANCKSLQKYDLENGRVFTHYKQRLGFDA